MIWASANKSVLCSQNNLIHSFTAYFTGKEQGASLYLACVWSLHIIIEALQRAEHAQASF